jgi:hypothetical protein
MKIENIENSESLIKEINGKFNKERKDIYNYTLSYKIIK